MFENIVKFFSPKNIHDLAQGHFHKILKRHKYDAQLYDVVTSDGHRLHMFNLVSREHPASLNKDKDLHPVLLQHGLIDSGDSWVLNQPEWSLAYYLLDKGYDVWIGNSRGNKYCKTHTNDGIKTDKFWDFSFQEMGRYDLPAMITKILDVTGHEKIAYVGHSQGTSQMFAALSCPQSAAFMNSKVAIFIALAPIVYLVDHSNLGEPVKLVVDKPLQLGFREGGQSSRPLRDVPWQQLRLRSAWPQHTGVAVQELPIAVFEHLRAIRRRSQVQQSRLVPSLCSAPPGWLESEML